MLKELEKHLGGNKHELPTDLRFKLKNLGQNICKHLDFKDMTRGKFWCKSQVADKKAKKAKWAGVVLNKI